MSETLDLRPGSYLGQAFGSPDEAIKSARLALREVRYDTMVGTGLSGALMVPILARGLDKKWAIVRKPGDGSHSFTTVEGELGKRWIFVDDFLVTGATKRRVLDMIIQLAMNEDFYTTFVGSYLYQMAYFFREGP